MELDKVEQLTKFFNLPVQSERDYYHEDIGIGLTICKKLIDKNHGKIKVYSKPR